MTLKRKLGHHGLFPQRVQGWLDPQALEFCRGLSQTRRALHPVGPLRIGTSQREKQGNKILAKGRKLQLQN